MGYKGTRKKNDSAKRGVVEIGDYDPLDAQRRFHGSLSKYRLYGGAMGGGKTRALCEGAVIDCLAFPGNRVLLCRRQLSSLMNTTYRSLVDKSTMRNLIDAGLVTENKGRRIFEFWNGSMLFYSGIEGSREGDEPVFSGEYGSIFVDEAFEITEGHFNKLATRLRHTLPEKLPDGVEAKFYNQNSEGKREPLYHISLASNPAQNWLKIAFISKPKEGFEFFPALPSDNKYNPDSYFNDLETLFRGDEQALKAYVEGSWDTVSAFDDLLSREEVNRCINSAIIGDGSNVLISCDPARYGDDTTVIQVWRDKVLDRVERFYHKNTMEVVGWLKHIKDQENGSVTRFVIDETGLGAGIVDRLSETESDVLGINFASKPTDNNIDRYANLRSEMYCVCADAIKKCEVKLKEGQDELYSQLCSIKFCFDSRGRKKIESKAEIKKRIGCSPDDADSAAMAIWALCEYYAISDEYINNYVQDPELNMPERWKRAWEKVNPKKNKYFE